MTLFRPVGLRELELIAELDWRAFPPRLPIQPVFYPVLTFKYAEKIARGWNTTDLASGFAGFVTRFNVQDEVAKRYEVQNAGGLECQELWIPAEELAEFNNAIIGEIEVVAAFIGERFEGEMDAAGLLPAHLSTNRRG